MSELNVVGQPVTRVDVHDKVTGTATYGYDLVLPDMVHGKVLFSTKAHAKIRKINLDRARRHPGVIAAICGADAPWTHGESIKDKPFLAQGKVRYAGEPVAAVAAIDEDTAQAALALVEVEYEDLPAYFTPESACAPDAVPIHENFEEYRKAAFIVSAPMPNVCEHFKLRTGNIADGFARSDLVLEESYTVPVIQHAAMEPHSAHAQVDPNTGRISVWVANDAPFRALTEIAEALGVPQEKIRLINPLQGGGFGSKGGLKVEAVAMALAFHTNGRPVRVKFNREETFISTLVRHEASVTIKSGVTKDGTLIARQMTLYWGAGAYAEKSPTVCIRGSLPAPGPYRIPHVHVDGYAVYTNKPVAGAFRGYGIPQGAWATEQHMDELAQRLKLDPLEFRLKNVFADGDTAYWGEKLHSVGLTETLTKAAEAIDWGKPRPSGVGRGLACISKPTRSPTTSKAAVLLNGQNEVTVLAGTVEIGQGCSTILSQVAAEELGMPLERVHMAPLDTDVIPFDASTTSSRSTYHMGNAVRGASIHLREQIAEMASPMLEGTEEHVVFEKGQVYLEGHPEITLTPGEVIRRKLGASAVLRGDASYTYEIGKDLDLETGHSDHASAFYMYATQAAEAVVDEETGRVRLLRLSAAHDVGKAINPLNCAAQIEGGVAMGIGAALHENLIIDDTGKVRNPSFLDYHLVTSLDLPKMIPIIVECPEPEGPYGAKGLGEPGLAPTPAAIGNAVANAINVRIYHLPLTPERVFWALKNRDRSQRSEVSGRNSESSD